MAMISKPANLLPSLLVAALLAAETTSLHAAQLGDADAGKRFAKETCASCHAIEKGAAASPDPDAPTFEAVANTPGLNRRALIVFFRTPHENMPNLIVQEDDTDNVIAYILSLKSND
jgi:mono/diheme cytochrome c family protein